MKKAISLLLCAVMLLTVLSGCNEDNSTPGDTTSPGQRGTQTDSGSEQGYTPGGGNGGGDAASPGSNVSSGGDGGNTDNSGGIDVPTVSSGIKVNIPGNATADEKAAYEYIQGAVEAFENGMEYDELGYIRPAEGFYGTAASTLCALRYAADCLLGEENADERIADWDIIASMGWGSPAAYFFEGLVCQAQGKTDEAAACWAKAAVNPVFESGGDTLKGIANIKGDALRRLRDEAARVEDEIFKLYTPVFYTVPRHENNCDPVYLSKQGAACLEQDEPDPASALTYYCAALSVNPFSGYNYACCVVAYIAMGDGDAAEEYLTEGLIIDPENKTLNELIGKIGEAAKQ